MIRYFIVGAKGLTSESSYYCIEFSCNDRYFSSNGIKNDKVLPLPVCAYTAKS